jgi:hypothetical protein
VKGENVKTLLLTAFFTVVNSIVVVGVLTFVSLEYLDYANIVYVVVGFFFFASLMAIAQIAGVFGQHPRKNDHVYALEFVVIFLASASILGVLGLQDEIIQKRHKFSVSEAKDFHSYASRELHNALKNVCGQDLASKSYCSALEKINQELAKGFEDAEVSATSEEYLIIMEENCCPSAEDAPVDIKAAKYFLNQYVKWKDRMKVTLVSASKARDDDSMLAPWLDISTFKLFLLFLGAIAGAIKVGLTASKYAESYAK